MKTKFIFFFLLFNFFNIRIVLSACTGRIFNPITDVCWSCILPISIASISVGGTVSDAPNVSTIPCVCPGKILGLPQIGIPIGFWEGIKIFDLIKDPFCMVSLGGIGIDASLFSGTGSNSNGISNNRYSNWHLHQYAMPIFQLLSMVFDTLCLEISSVSPFDLAYMTELDPLWFNDELTFILNPEAILFNNAIAQASCVADCVSATAYLPLDTLFWCGGCQGSLYPMTGNITADYGSIQTTVLTIQRFMYKMHRTLQAWTTSGVETLCQPMPNPIMKKSQYRTQLSYPVPMNAPGVVHGCQPFGRSNVLYDFGKEIPIKGENFGYLLWRKRNCCAL